MNIWTILNIEPTTDKKRIRQAYAQALKLTNPEDDPEGFAKLRQAYEEALSGEESSPREDVCFPLLDEKAQVKVLELLNSPQDQALKVFKRFVKEGLFADLSFRIAFEECLFQALYEFPPLSRDLFLALHFYFHWERRRFTENFEWLTDQHELTIHLNLLDLWKQDPSFTPLMQAVAMLDLEVVKTLLPSDLNSQTKNGDTALHLACLLRAPLIVEVLLQAGATVDVENSEGKTPLSIAVEHDDLEITEALTKAGANLKHQDVKNRSVFHLAVAFGSVMLLLFLTKYIDIKDEYGALRNAILNNQREKVKILVEHGVDLHLPPNGEEDTPIICAIRNQKPEILIDLLEHGADPNELQLDCTPLEFAAVRNNCHAIQALLRAGADLSHYYGRCIRRAFDFSQIEAAHLLFASLDPKKEEELKMMHCYAVQGAIAGYIGLEDEIRILYGLENYPPFTSSTLPPLHQAAYLGNLELLKKEVEHGGQINDIDPTFTLTPLYCAAQAGHTACVEFLLNQGAKPNITTHHGLAPLHAAIQNHHYEIMNLLLEYGADCNLAKVLMFSPLFIAVKFQNETAFDQLIVHGAKDHPTGFFHSALAPAVYNGNLEMLKKLTSHSANLKQVMRFRCFSLLYIAARYNQTEVLCYLLSLSLRPDWEPRSKPKFPENFQDLLPLTPLTAAIKNGNVEATQLLLEAKANPNRKSNGFPPLHFARSHPETAHYPEIENAYIQIIDLLLDAGAKIDAKAKNGDTYLIHVIRYRLEGIAIHLINNGADWTIPDAEGVAPLELAESHGLRSLAHLLKDHQIPHETHFIPN